MAGPGDDANPLLLTAGAASACHDRGMESVSFGPSTYRGLGERAWAWVLTQVKRGDEGRWLGEHHGVGRRLRRRPHPRAPATHTAYARLIQAS